MLSSSLSSASLSSKTIDWFLSLQKSRELILQEVNTKTEFSDELAQEAATCHRQLAALDSIFSTITGDNNFFSVLFDLSGYFCGRVLHTTPKITYSFDVNINRQPWLMAPSFGLKTFQIRKPDPKGFSPNLNYGFVRGENITNNNNSHYRYHPVVGIDNDILKALTKCSDSDVQTILDTLTTVVQYGGHDYIHQAVFIMQDCDHPTSFCHPDALVAKFPVQQSKFNSIFKKHLSVFECAELPIEEYSSCLNALAWDHVVKHDPDFFNLLRLQTATYLSALSTIKLNTQISDVYKKYMVKYLATIYFGFLDALCDAKQPEFCDMICPLNNHSIRDMCNDLLESESGFDLLVSISRGLGINNYRQAVDRQRYISASLEFTTDYHRILTEHLNNLPTKLT
jgi:hypothetical protein